MSKSVAEKMGIKAGSRAFIIRAPDVALRALDLPSLQRGSRLVGGFDYIHLFALAEAEVVAELPKLRRHLASTGMLWVSWPKAGKLDTDLTLQRVIGISYEHGLVESKTLAVDDTWSAIKLTHPKKGKSYHNRYGRLTSA